jgi:hypothetical protein
LSGFFIVQDDQSGIPLLRHGEDGGFSWIQSHISHCFSGAGELDGLYPWGVCEGLSSRGFLGCQELLFHFMGNQYLFKEVAEEIESADRPESDQRSVIQDYWPGGHSLSLVQALRVLLQRETGHAAPRGREMSHAEPPPVWPLGRCSTCQFRRASEQEEGGLRPRTPQVPFEEPTELQADKRFDSSWHIDSGLSQCSTRCLGLSDSPARSLLTQGRRGGFYALGPPGPPPRPRPP